MFRSKTQSPNTQPNSARDIRTGSNPSSQTCSSFRFRRHQGFRLCILSTCFLEMLSCLLITSTQQRVGWRYKKSTDCFIFATNRDTVANYRSSALRYWNYFSLYFSFCVLCPKFGFGLEQGAQPLCYYRPHYIYFYALPPAASSRYVYFFSLLLFCFHTSVWPSFYTKYPHIADKEFLLHGRHNMYFKLHVHGRRLCSPGLQSLVQILYR